MWTANDLSCSIVDRRHTLFSLVLEQNIYVVCYFVGPLDMYTTLSRTLTLGYAYCWSRDRV